MNTKIIAIANQKGGVAKTTSVLNIGVALCGMKKKVLLIDGDPQSSLSKAYMHITDTDDVVGMTELMAATMQHKPIDVSTAIHHNDINNIDYIPANIGFSGIETQLINTRLRESVMQRALDDKNIKGKYDYVIIDCPPSLSMLLYNELTAADEVIIPVEPEDMSIDGIRLLLDTIADVQEYTNPKLNVLGFVLTKTNDKSVLHRNIEMSIAETFSTIHIIGSTSRHMAAAESVSASKALALYRECPSNKYFNKLAYQYKAIAKYIDYKCEIKKKESV